MGARDHADLVSSVRDEIGTGRGRGGADPQTLLLAERERIESARQATDHVIQYTMGRGEALHPLTLVVWRMRRREEWASRGRCWRGLADAWPVLPSAFPSLGA